MKKSLFLFLCALCMFFSSCVKASHKSLLDQVKAKGELVVALEGAWEPWNYHDEHGRLVGFDVDVAKEMCKRMGVRAKFVEFEWERLFSCLENGECDIIVNGVAITTERKNRFYYTTPYAVEKTALIVRKDENGINSFEDLAGKTSANSLYSTYDNIAKKYGAMSIVVDTFDETMELLLSNRADSTINSILVYYNYVKNNPNAPVKIAAILDDAFQIAIPCRKSVESQSLLEEMNRAIDSMKADGTLANISAAYFGLDVAK